MQTLLLPSKTLAFNHELILIYGSDCFLKRETDVII